MPFAEMEAAWASRENICPSRKVRSPTFLLAGLRVTLTGGQLVASNSYAVIRTCAIKPNHKLPNAMKKGRLLAARIAGGGFEPPTFGL
jgi:hypothetical protein